VSTSSSASVHWHNEFAKVISCDVCSAANDPNLLRDGGDNLPQPGYVGSGYEDTGLLLVGQNPGLTISRTAAKDMHYFAALRALGAERTEQRYAELEGVLVDLIPDWPVQKGYFPLRECNLGLKDIAYCNLVRCRTKGNTPPKSNVAATCSRMHFGSWLDMLNPSCVVFIGLWARDHGGSVACDVRRIPYEVVNRKRSLSNEERTNNSNAVAAFVRRHIRPTKMQRAAQPSEPTDRPNVEAQEQLTMVAKNATISRER
jgi:uracil-DNA glycosylase